MVGEIMQINDNINGAEKIRCGQGSILGNNPQWKEDHPMKEVF